MIGAASVKDRLKNRAIAGGKTMQEMLTAYGVERTVYRLAISEYADCFTLKGGVFLYALFEGKFVRATRDIDFLAKNIPNSATDMEKVFENVFGIECDDALRYDLTTLEVRDITEFKEYHGINVSIMAYLDNTRVPISIDIGFGDVIYPARVKMEFPVLLDMNVPEIFAYSLYSVIAEKFEAIVSLGDANSRYKDFYDIYILAGRYRLDGEKLREAIRKTFENRKTGFEDIIAFTDVFEKSEIHQNRWRSFLKKKKTLVYVDFSDVLGTLITFLAPIVESIRNGDEFAAVWNCEDQRWER